MRKFAILERCKCGKCETGSRGWGNIRNQEEGEHPLFEAANKQLLVNTEKTLCVL
jgi:hypothetical protein